jgi:hypothetical protein
MAEKESDTAMSWQKCRERLQVLEAECKSMIDIAGEAIGTDPTLRSSACVTVLAEHAKTLRNDRLDKALGVKSSAMEVK